jgi:hypothetical protein
VLDPHCSEYPVATADRALVQAMTGNVVRTFAAPGAGHRHPSTPWNPGGDPHSYAAALQPAARGHYGAGSES